MAVIDLRTWARLARRPFAEHMVLTTAVAGVIAAGSLAGCGTAPTAGVGHAGSHQHAAKAALTIKVTNEGGRVMHWTLRCDPPGGTSPDPAATCRTLFGAKNPLSPPRHDVMCPMIMVSGKQIIVDGTWFGHKVHRIIIDGSCDLTIFNNLAKTFR